MASYPPHTPTTNSPCLPGPIDPLIRYSQSPLLGRPPSQLCVRDGMWSSAPLRITIPVIYCYNTASHFWGGWLERYRIGVGRGWSLLLVWPPHHHHQKVCIPAEGFIQLETCLDLRDVMKQPRTVTLVPTRHDRNNLLVFNWHIFSKKTDEHPTFSLHSGDISICTPFLFQNEGWMVGVGRGCWRELSYHLQTLLAQRQEWRCVCVAKDQ